MKKIIIRIVLIICLICIVFIIGFVMGETHQGRRQLSFELFNESIVLRTMDNNPNRAKGFLETITMDSLIKYNMIHSNRLALYRMDNNALQGKRWDEQLAWTKMRLKSKIERWESILKKYRDNPDQAKKDVTELINAQIQTNAQAQPPAAPYGAPRADGER